MVVNKSSAIGEDAPRRSIHLSKYSNIGDAFNRVRVSTPVGTFESQMQYDTNPLFWNQDISTTSATVAHLPNESSVRLRVTGDESVIRQTKQYHTYQPGKSQLILTTIGSFGSATGVNKRVGYFDEENGVFLQSDEDGYYITMRSYTTGTAIDVKVANSAWNIDNFNGNGPSKVLLDMTKIQILVIDLAWFGVGRVRVGFVVEGVIHYAHEFLKINVSTTTYMSTASLPIRYEIVGSISATGNNDLVQIAVAVISEGGFESPTGIPLAISNDTTSVSATTSAETVILAIRPTTTFNSITNRIRIVPQSVVVFSEDENIHYHTIYGANILGGSWVPVSTSYSGVEYNKTSTGHSGGIDIHEDYVSAASVGVNTTAGGTKSKILGTLPICLAIDGTHPSTGIRDTICVTATGVSATAAAYAVIEWLEIK